MNRYCCAAVLVVLMLIVVSGCQKAPPEAPAAAVALPTVPTTAMVPEPESNAVNYDVVDGRPTASGPAYIDSPVIAEELRMGAYKIQVGCTSDNKSYIELARGNGEPEKAVLPRHEVGEFELAHLTSPYSRSEREGIKYLACSEEGAENSRVLIFEPDANIEQAAVIVTRQSCLQSLCWSPDGNLLLAGNEIYLITKEEESSRLSAHLKRRIHSGKVGGRTLRITEAIWFDNGFGMGDFVTDQIKSGGKIVMHGVLDAGENYPQGWAGLYDVDAGKWREL